MSDAVEARELALALPEAVEQDHHGMASFRVRGTIFATLPEDEHLRVMVDESEIRAAVAEYPDICVEVWWGRRLSAVAVTLTAASADLVRELLTEAWLRRAPKTLAAGFHPR